MPPGRLRLRCLIRSGLAGRVSVAAADHVGDQAGAAGLVRGAEPGPVVTMEVLTEDQVVAPGRVALQQAGSAEAGPAAPGAAREDRDEPVAQVAGDQVQGEQTAGPGRVLRVAGQRVQVPPVFLDVLAVIALRSGQAERALLQDRVGAVPQCQPQAQPLLDVAEPGQPVLASAVGTGAGVLVRQVAPRLAVRAVIFADRPPLALADVRSPLIPLAGLAQPVLQLPETSRPLAFSAHRRPSALPRRWRRAPGPARRRGRRAAGPARSGCRRQAVRVR